MPFFLGCVYFRTFDCEYRLFFRWGCRILPISRLGNVCDEAYFEPLPPLGSYLLRCLAIGYTW